MTDNETNGIEVVLKDFAVPAPNGQMYNVEAEVSQNAIGAFLQRVKQGQVRGEIFSPALGDQEVPDRYLKRVTSIDESRVGFQLLDGSYNENTKCIKARLQPNGPMGSTARDLVIDPDFTFGMRAFVDYTDGQEHPSVAEIITFDLIRK